MAVGLALVVALAFGAGAFALFVWPGTGEPARPNPIYSAENAVGRVRASLSTEGECKEGHRRWAAVRDPTSPNMASWLVAEVCHTEEGKPLITPDELEGQPFASFAEGAIWRVRDEDGTVIPLTDLAAEFMAPTCE